jgi:hypothetical protein
VSSKNQAHYDDDDDPRSVTHCSHTMGPLWLSLQLWLKFKDESLVHENCVIKTQKRPTTNQADLQKVFQMEEEKHHDRKSKTCFESIFKLIAIVLVMFVSVIKFISKMHMQLSDVFSLLWTKIWDFIKNSFPLIRLCMKSLACLTMEKSTVNGHAPYLSGKLHNWAHSDTS